MQQSFSRPGEPHDNAVAESFFASLKKEELYRRNITSDRAFQASVASYIEFYNTKRPHRTLKNLTPCQMEENFNNVLSVQLNPDFFPSEPTGANNALGQTVLAVLSFLPK